MDHTNLMPLLKFVSAELVNSILCEGGKDSNRSKSKEKMYRGRNTRKIKWEKKMQSPKSKKCPSKHN